MVEPTQRLKADATLLLAAFVWGTSFVVQRIATAYFGYFLFNGLRFLLGAMVLLPLLYFYRLGKPTRHELGLSAIAGLVLVGASSLQQAGLQYTTAANAGFLTTLYVVLVPGLLWFFWRRKIRWLNWLAAGLAVLGALFLSGAGLLSLGHGQAALGDSLEALGAILWAVHVIVVGQLRKGDDPLRFAALQFGAAGLVNLGLGLAFEGETLAGLEQGWWTVVYIGVFSTALAYTLQVVAQRHTAESDAALLLSLEAVFAALNGWIFLQETLLPLQLLGCALIFGAALLAQVRSV